MYVRMLDKHDGTLDVHGVLHDGDVQERDDELPVLDDGGALELEHDDGALELEHDDELLELEHDDAVEPNDAPDVIRALPLLEHDCYHRGVQVLLHGVRLHCEKEPQNDCHHLCLLEQPKHDRLHYYEKELKSAVVLLHHYVNAVRKKPLT